MTRLLVFLGGLSLCILSVAAAAVELPSRIERASHESKAEQYTAVPNGKEWHDINGNVIQAWGGNYYEEDSTFYWVGQNLPSIGLQASDDFAMIK